MTLPAKARTKAIAVVVVSKAAVSQITKLAAAHQVKIPRMKRALARANNRATVKQEQKPAINKKALAKRASPARKRAKVPNKSRATENSPAAKPARTRPRAKLRNPAKNR